MSNFPFGKMDGINYWNITKYLYHIKTICFEWQLFFFFFLYVSVFVLFFMYSLPLIHCKSLLVRPCTNNVRGRCLELWSKHLEYHLNVQSSMCVCMRAHVCMCVRENQIPHSALKTKREKTKYINWQQFTKGTRGKPNQQLFPKQVVIQLPKIYKMSLT